MHQQFENLDKKTRTRFPRCEHACNLLQNRHRPKKLCSGSFIVCNDGSLRITPRSFKSNWIIFSRRTNLGGGGGHRCVLFIRKLGMLTWSTSKQWFTLRMQVCCGISVIFVWTSARIVCFWIQIHSYNVQPINPFDTETDDQNEGFYVLKDGHVMQQH